MTDDDLHPAGDATYDPLLDPRLLLDGLRWGLAGALLAGGFVAMVAGGVLPIAGAGPLAAAGVGPAAFAGASIGFAAAGPMGALRARRRLARLRSRPADPEVP